MKAGSSIGSSLVMRGEDSEREEMEENGKREKKGEREKWSVLYNEML